MISGFLEERLRNPALCLLFLKAEISPFNCLQEVTTCFLGSPPQTCSPLQVCNLVYSPKDNYRPDPVNAAVRRDKSGTSTFKCRFQLCFIPGIRSGLFSFVSGNSFLKNFLPAVHESADDLQDERVFFFLFFLLLKCN